MNRVTMQKKACQFDFCEMVFFAFSSFWACSVYANDVTTCLEYYDTKQFEKAYSCFLQPHIQENPEVQYCLGVIYLKGKGVNQDYFRARQGFEKSASHGFRAASSGWEPGVNTVEGFKKMMNTLSSGTSKLPIKSILALRPNWVTWMKTVLAYPKTINKPDNGTKKQLLKVMPQP